MSRSARVRLTTAGTAVGAGALGLVGVGAITGYTEFLVLGIAALAVVAVSFLLPRATSAVTFRRDELPRFVERGSTMSVRLSATAEHLAPATRIYEQMAGVPIAVDLPRVTPHEPTVVTFRVRALRRGAHQLGPLLEERTDPFVLATRTIAHDVVDEVVVHPVIHRLALPDSANRAREALEAQARLSEDPVSDFRSLREYVPGDDQRRIHWMSTAKTGTVLVRDTFELRRATKTVLLETLDRTATEALFEDAVEIAASLAVEAVRRQVTVVVRTRDQASPGQPRAVRHREDLLELFGRVQRTTDRDTVPAGRALGSGEPSDQIILVAGASSPLIGQLCGSPTLRTRLLVIRMVDGSSAAPRLPVRSIDVGSIDDFLFAWRRGLVPA